MRSLCLTVVVGLLIGGLACSLAAQATARPLQTLISQRAAPPVPFVPTPNRYPGEGSGVHYWIDGATGDDGNPGTQASPWASVDRLETASLGPGDLVHVRPGLYGIQGSLRLTGLHGDPQAWIGLHAEGAVTLRNTAVQNVVNIEDCHYLFVRGFEITHDNRGLPYGFWDAVDGVKFQTAPSDHVAIDDCHIHHVGNVGVASQAPRIDAVQVVDCEIHDCYVGLYWGYYEAADKRYAHDGIIARNYVHDCPPVDLDGTGYGIQIKGGSRGNLIEDNVLVRTAGHTRAAIAVYHISTQFSAETDRNIIRGNFIRASRHEGIYASEGALIQNNVLVDSGAVGIEVTRRETGGWGSFYGDLELRNNSVYGVDAVNGQALFTGSGPFTGQLRVTNNLLVVTGGGQLSMRLPPGFAGLSVQNHCFGAVSGSTQGVVSLPDLRGLLSVTYGDAGFLFPTPDGALVSGSQTATAPARDFHGVVRDAQPDAGAFESTGRGNPAWTLADGFKP
jgi:hypothetical protein